MKIRRTSATTRRRGGAARGVLMLLLVCAAAAAFFLYRRGDAADEVKREMLAIVREIQLPDDWRAAAEQYVQAAHEKAFNKALDIKKKLGEKFDANVYFNDVFDQIVAWAREDGKPELADKLEQARGTYSLGVTER